MMATERISQGTRYWPTGLDDLGADTPSAVYVRGRREHLPDQAVVFDGSPYTTPQGTAQTTDLARGIASTDVVVVGDFENPAARQAVLAAAREGGAAVLYSRRPLDSLEDRELPYWVNSIVANGGAVVSFSPDGGDTLPVDEYRRALAAHSTVVFVEEATDEYSNTQMAEYADKLGRAVAVAEHPSYEGARYAGIRELREFSNATVVNGSRAVLNLVGPAPRTSNDELMATLDHLEFSGRVGHLRQAGRIDAQTERNLLDMASESKDLTEFKTRMHYGGARMMGAAEYRYLVTTLETPEGQRPQTWDESEAYARAFGFDRYESICRISQMERDREQHAQLATTQ